MALQRKLLGQTDEQIRRQLEDKFLSMMFAPNRETALYVGNQAKRVHVFSVLGVYYPER